MEQDQKRLADALEHQQVFFGLVPFCSLIFDKFTDCNIIKERLSKAKKMEET